MLFFILQGEPAYIDITAYYPDCLRKNPSALGKKTCAFNAREEKRSRIMRAFTFLVREKGVIYYC